jgi:mevalonate kinase
MQQFRANGKLLLSGEYVILDGAKGLCLPTTFGQTLTVDAAPEPGIHWTALDNTGQPWFTCTLSPELELMASNNPDAAAMLVRLLRAAMALTNSTLPQFSAVTRLEFPNDWGLGSSSTLVSLIGQFLGCDPYALLAASFGGSGYDVACATATGPILYQVYPGGRDIQPVTFNPEFRAQLYFLHLGKKQDSRAGIRQYRETVPDPTGLVEQISDITGKLLGAIDLDEFSYYLRLHESLIGQALGVEPVRERLFPDFPGAVKSLGAWGGDFVLVASDEEEDLLRRYFIDKGYYTLLKYSEVIPG